MLMKSAINTLDSTAIARKEIIDVTFDFTMDCVPNYWDGFWERGDGLGVGAYDPDEKSPTLKRYHQLLWSKTLPNGEFFELTQSGSDYLRWRDMRFGSDFILSSFRYKKNKDVIRKVSNYRALIEDFLHKAYTIGGMVIFPKHTNSMNVCRGRNNYICDRWDLSLECIRRFYNGEDSPLASFMEQDRNFYSLFNDFKGYIDFFYLQDCVTEDYKRVNFWLGDGSFSYKPLPKNPEEYNTWISSALDFVKKRNARIKESVALYR